MDFSDKHHKQLLEDGYTLIKGFLTPSELRAAQKALFQHVPTGEEMAATPARFQPIVLEEELHKLEFPYVEPALNFVATHPRIIRMVEKLLGTTDLLLSRSAIWSKYAGGESYDQAMHLDFEGNTLVMPRDDGDYRQVNIILYYSDVTETLGPTKVVSQKKTKGDCHWPPFRYRKDNAPLYDMEKSLVVKAGSMLVFSMRTFHRGSEMTEPGGARFTHHMVYRAARHAFQGYRCWPSYGEFEDLKDFLESATPRQREVLGFPPPQSDYWTPETVYGVSLRYPEMDMTPYIEALNQGKGKKKR